MKQVISARLLVKALTFTTIVLCSFTVSAQRASFSGDWKLDEAKSDLGEFGAWTARSIKVEQKDDAITTQRTSPGFNGGDPIVTNNTLTFDGKVEESEGFGGSKRKSTAKWSDDGKTLTINSTMNFEWQGEPFEVKSVETWTITPDGLLSVVTNSTSTRGDSTVKAVYTK